MPMLPTSLYVRSVETDAPFTKAPAAIVVVIDGGLKQVYAVERTCTKGNPHTLAGPFPMT